MRCAQVAVVVLMTLVGGCGGSASQMPSGAGWERHVIQRGISGGDPGLRATQFRADICDGFDLRPETSTLTEANVSRFLQQQGFQLQVQRQVVDPQNPELHYVFVNIPGLADPIPLRVAVLQNADGAGRALHEALIQRGAGAWGVHRGNIALLGPRGSNGDDIAFAVSTKLACWGTLTIEGSDEAIVVAGGYAEP